MTTSFNLFDAFERIYLINLPERKDRLREALAELERAGISRTDKRLHIFAGIKPDDAGIFPSRGAHGCHLSHLSIIRTAIHDGIRNVLIIEDDILLHPLCSQSQPQLVKGIQNNDWDFAYVGHCEAFGEPSDSALRWKTTEAPLVCAHFYALNRRILVELEAYLSACMLRPAGHPDGGPMHIDGAYSMFRQRTPKLTTLIASSSLGGQRSSRSDIYPNQWFDRTPVVRTLVAMLRQCRNLARQLSL